MKKLTSNGVCGSILLMALFVPARSEASVITFTTRATWQAATSAASWQVDFGAFPGADTFFANGTPVDAGPFSLSGPNVFGACCNSVGSSRANLYVEHDFGQTVDMSFDSPIFAWGADFSSLSGNELGFVNNLVIDLFSPAHVLLGTVATPFDGLTNMGPGFFGFATTAGEQVGSLTFRSAVGDTGSGAIAFVLDNVTGVAPAASAVPEPATLLLLGTGLAAVAARRRFTKRT